MDSVVRFLFHPTYKNQEETQLGNILLLAEVYWSTSPSLKNSAEASLRCLATSFRSGLKNKILHYGPEGLCSTTTSAHNTATCGACDSVPLAQTQLGLAADWMDGWMDGFQKLKWRFIFRARETLKNACVWAGMMFSTNSQNLTPPQACPATLEKLN